MINKNVNLECNNNRIFLNSCATFWFFCLSEKKEFFRRYRWMWMRIEFSHQSNSAWMNKYFVNVLNAGGIIIAFSQSNEWIASVYLHCVWCVFVMYLRWETGTHNHYLVYEYYHKNTLIIYRREKKTIIIIRRKITMLRYYRVSSNNVSIFRIPTDFFFVVY